MRLQTVAFVVLCILWVLLLPLSLLMAVMSPMLSDAGVNTQVWILMGDFATFPLACLLAPVAGWIAWRKDAKRLAWALVALPTVWIAVPAVVWGFFAP